ncbi:hypothetical protein M8994_14340 [Brucella sp. 21LCYQ03]|nr:hypothetical protein [Brucella sp. 21LCYQ03]
MVEVQAHAFTDAVMRKVGGLGLARPDNLADLQKSLSDGCEGISKRNTLTLDKEMVINFVRTVNATAQQPMLSLALSSILLC